jgi:lysine 2,3-aminomutase
MQRDYKTIPLFQDVTDDQWHDWRWQVRHRLTSTGEFAQVVNLDERQRGDLNRCMGRFRVAVTPYYASLMDPDDESCPVRKQGIPTPAELIVGAAEMKDGIAETIDSPTRLITHRYPDRVLFITTEMCSMYCRHCTRRRIVGESEGKTADTDYENALTYIERNEHVRDVLLSGGDPLTLPDEKLEWLLQRVTAIDHVEIVRIGTRMPVVCPQRITPELCSMLAKYHPLYVNTHFNHPVEVTPEAERACGMLADAGISLGNQTVLMRGVNDCAKVMLKLVRRLVQIRVKPYYFYQCDLAEGTAHFRTSVAKGLEIYESLRGHTTGFAVPMYIIDAIGGGGKTPVIPQYLISMAENRVVLRNYEGMISKYVEPDDYRFECHCEDCESERQRKGVAGLYDTDSPLLEDTWASRWQKVDDRKALVSDLEQVMAED